MRIAVRKAGDGLWCVYADGNWLSDHATDDEARAAAGELAAALADEMSETDTTTDDPGDAHAD